MYEYVYKRIMDYTLNEYRDHDLDCYPIKEKINNFLVNNYHVFKFTEKHIIISFENRLSNEEERNLDNIINQLNNNYETSVLNKYKEIKIQELRDNIEIIASYGFEFPPGSGIKFNVSTIVAGIWHRIEDAVKSNLMTNFPIVIRDINNNPHYLNNKTEVEQFYLMGFYIKSLIFNSTTQLIQQVKAMTKLEDVINFEDPRL